MDFYRIRERSAKNEVVEVFPDFKVARSQDLMIRAKSFYAIWDEKAGLWSTDEYDVQRLIDEELWAYRNELVQRTNSVCNIKLLGDFSSNSWLQFRNYIGHLTDNSVQLDEKLTFSNTEVKKSDYVSRRLPYALVPGDTSAWREIVDTLYEPTEREKIEWAIGAILSGDSKKIQKFLVFYGAPGTGKGTIMNIIQMLFEGYYVTFDAKALTQSGNAFSTEVFKSNPLVAIQHDGDLSKIEDNTKLNSIVSHEDMTMNEKYKPSYTSRVNAFLFMGTNKPVKFTDAKSGLIRRLIDVQPSGAKLSPRRYQMLMNQIEFELGAIASHCLEVYRDLGKHYYSDYRAVEMMLQTDIFYNFIEANYEYFSEQDGVSLTQAHAMYKEFCKESDLEFTMPRHRLRDELRNYFDNFEDRATMLDGERVRSYFSGFSAERFKAPVKDEKMFSLVMEETTSLFDEEYGECPAQYAGGNETPGKFWTNTERMMRNPKNGQQELMVPPDNLVVDTVLSELDTKRIHYVKVPLNHIVIDFDLKDANGNKSAERNLEAASQWPPTYAEFSKSGNGVHLHYLWDGDVSELSRVYDDGIEVKVFTGNSSLRRRLSKCNNVPIATISSGLPLQEKKMINADSVKSELSLRHQIEKNLRKEVHAGTKPSVDFIKKILDDAYNSELLYDVSDMRMKVLTFASGSSNHALYCMKQVQGMQFASKVKPGDVDDTPIQPTEDRVVYFDVEVFPNLFVVCWKYAGDSNVVRMINPSQHAIENLLKMPLVGFNNRKYDNHILYAALMGFNNEQLYRASKKIIENRDGAMFGEAYNLSYADIFEYSSKKQSLKKFQIELGLEHDELGFDWDAPVPEHLWDRVAEYCANDVVTTEQVAENRKGDFIARQILAALSGLSINQTTQAHASRIIFGENKRPQEQFKYTQLSKEFEGYSFSFGKSTYRDEITGEGGYVYSEPGIHYNVTLLDITSMHPTTIEQLELFGPEYTKNFSDIKNARVAIKNEDFEAARKMLDGKLAPYLNDEEGAEALSDALKIVINIVYGLTSAKFDNAFRDPRNIDNIVAKRGALFMIDLKHAVQEQGYQVIHIKTDSIKIANADAKIIAFVMEFGKRYGYNFEHEATYEKMALVNDAVYVARVGWAAKAKKIGTWEAVGTQFQIPFVFKTLFSHEPITFRDKQVEKHVQTALYLDFTSLTEGLLEPYINEKKMHFIGKGGAFCPIIPGKGGGELVREKDGKFHAATGAKGYYWLEAPIVKNLKKEKDIDMSYFQKMVDDAMTTIGKFGDAEAFIAVEEKVAA